jgi:hypothetical protein
MQSTIHDFRKQRINEMKRASTGAAVQQPRTKKDMSFEELQELCKHEAAVRQAVREALRPAPKVGESDAYVVVTRLLHRVSWVSWSLLHFIWYTLPPLSRFDSIYACVSN